MTEVQKLQQLDLRTLDLTDVDLGPLFQTPKEAVKQAIENDVHVIGFHHEPRRIKPLYLKLSKNLKTKS